MLIHEKSVLGTILRTVAAITIACASIHPRVVLAQTTTTATLTGVVVDEADGTVPDVRVTLVNLDNGLQRTVTTNSEGAFAAPLPAGRYTVTAQREGFAPAEVPDVLLSANEPLALRILLKVAAITEAVVVTAQKREERLQDVPVPVAVINAQQLASNSQLLLRDYYSTVPGLSVAPIYLGRQELSIRGVMTGGQSNPTVGVTIDDVPYTASTVATGGPSLPDIDPGDLARIEVLRGPQGTLYGANSMGGLIKYVTIDPSFQGYSGRVEFGTHGVSNGDQPGYNLRASFNLPVSDTWAIRASAFTRQDPGYIDNPVLHIQGVNKAVAGGGRLAALWRPSRRLSLRLSGTYQRAEADGASEIEVLPGLGDLQQNFLAGTRGFDKTVHAYNAVFKATVGSAELTSISGYSFNDFAATDDRGYAVGAAVEALYGVTGVRYLALNPTHKTTQEVRVSAPIGRRFAWQLGAFYTHESQRDRTTMDAEDTTTGQVVARFFEYNSRDGVTFDEYAVFTGLTYQATDRFDIQVGARQSTSTLVRGLQTTEGPYTSAVLGQPSPIVTPRTESNANAFTYLVTPRLKMSPDLMVYARLASGYRPGGPNPTVAVANGAPPQSKPDKTHNYEIGIKGNFFDQALSVDASLYYIDWSDIQIGLRSPLSIWTDNGGTAKSQGVELSATAMPWTGLAVTGSAAFNDAVLTRAFPAASTAYGAAGDRLPFATRYSAYVSLEQAFALRSDASVFIGGAVGYVGDRMAIFQATALRQELPAYTKIDLRGGVRRDSWTAHIFVNNAADERGLINGGIGYIPSNAFAYIQPRTVGLSLSRSF